MSGDVHYEYQRDGEWVRPQSRGFREMCCDCGLVHTVDFKIRRSSSGRPEIWYRMYRDSRATAKARKCRKHKFPCKKRKRKVDK